MDNGSTPAFNMGYDTYGKIDEDDEEFNKRTQEEKVEDFDFDFGNFDGSKNA
jgi:hypothetical protein